MKQHVPSIQTNLASSKSVSEYHKRFWVELLFFFNEEPVKMGISSNGIQLPIPRSRNSVLINSFLYAA